MKIIINDRKKYFLYFVFIFIVSRIIYYFLGIKFEIFLSAWQYFPIEFYKSNLLNSLFYNFSQPPFLNFLVGISIKVSENYFILILNIIYLIVSFLSFFYLMKLLILLGFKEKKSFLSSVFFMLLPTTLLLENHGYKDFLVFACLVFSIYLSIKIIDSESIINFFLLGISVSILCLLRETFHIFWAYLFFIYIFLIIRNKKIFYSFFIVTFFVLTFYLKNLLVFNHFQLGGWMYENLTQKAQYVSRFKKQDDWLKKIIFKNDENFNNFTSKLSPIWKNAVFTSAYEYKIILNYNYKFSHPLLHTNTFHNEIMIRVDEIRKDDFYKYLNNYPEIFVFSSLNAFFRHFFNSTDSFLFFENNSKKIPFLIKFSDCIKITLRCFYEIEIPKQYFKLTNYEKIYFSLNQINFLFVIVYLFLLYKILKTLFFFKKLDKKQKTLCYWILSFFFNLLILVLFEDTEIPRHRFPFDYLAIVFLFYLYKIQSFKKLI